MHIAKLVLFGLLGITACVASSPSDPTETTEAEATSQLGEQPAAGCGYTCSETGIVGLPLQLCIRTCGGAQNCTPTPSPCP